MRVKGKRVLKNGVTAGYVRQEDGSWKWRFLSGPKKSRKRGGVKNNNNIKPINIRPNNIPLAGVNTSGLQHIAPGHSVVSNLQNQRRNTRRNKYIHTNKISLPIANTSGLQRRANGLSVISNIQNHGVNAERNNQRANAPTNARRNNQHQIETIPKASMINKITIPQAFVTDQNISNHKKQRGFLGRVYNTVYAGSNLPNKQHDLHREDFLYSIDNLKRIRTDINKDNRHLKKKEDLRAMNDLLDTSISKRYFIYFVDFLNNLPDDIKFAEGFLRPVPGGSDLDNF